MAIDTSPPRWLESLAARPVDYTGLGRTVGNYLGALGTTAIGSGDAQIEQQPFGDRYRTNLANTYKQERNPNWRLQEFMAQAQYEHAKLQGQSLALRGAVAFRQMQQQVDSEKEMADWAEQARQNGVGPEGVLNTPYTGSNPMTMKMVGEAQLGASRALVQRRLNSDKTVLNSLINKMSLSHRADIISRPKDENGNPTPETVALIQQYASEDDAAAKNTQNFKNLPLADQLYQRMLRYESEGDDEGADIMRRELESRKSKELNHSDNSILQDAFIRRRQADRLLAEPKTKDDAETMRRVLVQKRNAEADIQRLMAHRSQAQPATSAPVQPVPATAPPATSTNRVIDFDQSGQLYFQKP